MDSAETQAERERLLAAGFSPETVEETLRIMALPPYPDLLDDWSDRTA